MEVEFKIEGEAKWRTAKVIQAQPKAGGKYKNWVNVEEKDGKQVCIRWSDVEKWKEIVNEQSTDDGTEKDTDENVLLKIVWKRWCYLRTIVKNLKK